MNLYCVTCSQGEEATLCALLQKKDITAFFPRAERHFRIQQKNILAVKPLMKGCIVLRCEMEEDELFRLLMNQRDVQIVRLGPFAADDYEHLQALMDEEHIIRMSRGVSVNREFHVAEGPLQGYEYLIRKNDRHKRFAEIDIRFNGKTVLVGLEVTEKR